MSTYSYKDLILFGEGLKVYFSLARSLTEVLTFKKGRNVRAVDGVNIYLPRNKVTCLVGESGCGKTTLGRSIIGLIRPTEGRIYYKPSKELEELMEKEGVSKREDFYDITDVSGKIYKLLRRELQIVFQDPYGSLNPRMTVKEILEEPLIIHGIGESEDERLEMVIKALTDVKLTPPEEFLNLYPFQLSGGQRQRVNIARALILGAKVVVADEPVSMLDVSIRAEILKLMLDLKENRDLTYLFITHDLAVASIICDYINIMYLGKIVERGPTDEVIKNPKHPYTQALLVAVPQPDPKGRWIIKEVPIKGEVPSAINIPPGCRFHLRCLYAMDICQREEPPEYLVGKDHYSACWLHKEKK
ncbi:MAG: ABC transporter ATP-binding protein [Desulfurococcales archaeon]|nr:ABC transporter ATP-binding protein [Desulfurococcales archaeon]